ncbi:MAG: GNAT family N-acetyltransferase [Lachnospiraceae bacterium]
MNYKLLIEKDEWNSLHFGKKMGNVYSSALGEKEKQKSTQDIFAQLILDAKKEEYEHLTFKIRTNEKDLVKGAIEQNFMLADTLITCLYDFRKNKLPEISHVCELGDCKEADMKALKKIAKESFKIDRFHSDPSLDNALCDEYYEKWFENSVNGLADKTIVAYYKDEPVGFTTVKIYENRKYGQLVLVAVSNKYRGIGVCTSMIYTGFKYIQEKYSNRVEGVLIGTQIDNIAMQKAWAKLGLSIYDSDYVFQKDIIK